MNVAVAREVVPGEKRVALVPESVKKLTAAGIKVSVEKDAGAVACFADEAYKDVGAVIEGDVRALYDKADLVAKVGVPARNDRLDAHEAELYRPESMILTGLMPLRNLEVVEMLASRRVSAFSTDAIPRTTRAQAMDTLSSMANIGGYRGALMAAQLLGKYTPMLMTAAGTIPSAKYFVIGAGVAGLQAIATSRRIGASVYATDVRPEVKEQIESVGAKYVGIDLKVSAQAGGGYAKELSEDDKARQRQMLVEQCAISDAVITTALIGGAFAPKLITAEMVRRMKPGSVIVDLAAEGGGNCELSRPGETIISHGVTIAAPLNVPSTMPTHASVLWSRNLTNFILNFWKEKEKTFNFDLKDEILAGALITHAGEVVHAKTREALQRRAVPQPV